MNLETKITIYKFTPQVFTLTLNFRQSEQEESSVLYSSELCAELLYFCIERFGSSVC